MKRTGPGKRTRRQNRSKNHKKIYETPKLTKFGSIALLTQGGAGAPTDPTTASVVTG